MIKLLFLLAISLPVFGAPTCNAFSSGGVHKRCPNVSYDATIPSNQTYARWIAAIFNPIGQDAAVTPCTVIMLEGKGWNGISQNFAEDITSAASHFVSNFGCAVYAIYYTWPVGMQVTASHSVGDTSLVFSTPLGSGTPGWFPNTTGCVDGCAGISTPFTMLYGANTANAETITCTAQSGTANLTCTVNALTKNHSANEYAYIPTTQWPADLADLVSFLNWLAANAGKGTYPGSATNLLVLAQSSSAHLFAKLPQVSATYCLSTGCGIDSWYGNSTGFNGGSSNSPGTWSISRMFLISTPWDLNYMNTNSTSGSSKLAQAIFPALAGCVIGTDTGCPAFMAAISPITLTSTQFPGAVASTSGNSDFTTPVCPAGQTWVANQPCTGNMYQVSGRPYLVFQSPPYTGTAVDAHGCNIFAPNNDVSNTENGCWRAAINFLFGNVSGSSAGASGP